MAESIVFATPNSTYMVTETSDGRFDVTRRRNGDEDAALVRGDIPAEEADGFEVFEVVCFNPNADDKADVADKRVVRFALTNGGRVTTGWADDRALAFEPADVERLMEIDVRLMEAGKAHRLATT